MKTKNNGMRVGTLQAHRLDLNHGTIAAGLRKRARSHSTMAKRASKAGNITDTSYHCCIATVYSGIATEFEQEAGG